VTDEYAEFWASRANTSRTLARIRLLSRLDEAKFADGHCSVGVIDAVVSREGTDGEGFTTTRYTLTVTAVLPEATTIRRHIDWGVGDSRGRDNTWAGRRISFRHNSRDPDDLADEQAAGRPDGDAERS